MYYDFIPQNKTLYKICIIPKASVSSVDWIKDIATGWILNSVKILLLVLFHQLDKFG